MIYVIERKAKRKGSKWQAAYTSAFRGIGKPYTLKKATRERQWLISEEPRDGWRIAKYDRIAVEPRRQAARSQTQRDHSDMGIT